MTRTLSSSGGGMEDGGGGGRESGGVSSPEELMGPVDNKLVMRMAVSVLSAYMYMYCVNMKAPPNFVQTSLGEGQLNRESMCPKQGIVVCNIEL